MKRFIVLSILLIGSLGSNSAQTTAEFEGDVRISNTVARLELFDNGAGKQRVQGYLTEIGDIITLGSIYGDLTFRSGNDVQIVSNNISTISPLSDFMISHESGSSATHGFTLRNNGGNDNYWTFYVLNGDGHMSLTRNGTVVGTFASNGVYTASDRRLKQDIEPLNPVLSRILNLKPKKYNYITSDNLTKSIGFVAQEVKKHFPELVLDGRMDEGEAVMQVNYAGFGVVAIKAIQEQQIQIERQGQIIDSQEKRIKSQAQLIEVQGSALNALEAQVNSLVARTVVLEKGGKGL